jgi:hypothetical protein
MVEYVTAECEGNLLRALSDVTNNLQIDKNAIYFNMEVVLSPSAQSVATLTDDCKIDSYRIRLDPPRGEFADDTDLASDYLTTFQRKLGKLENAHTYKGDFLIPHIEKAGGGFLTPQEMRVILQRIRRAQQEALNEYRVEKE